MCEPLELHDIQRLVLSGLRRHRHSAFLLCTLRDPALTRAWLVRQLELGAIPAAAPVGREHARSEHGQRDVMMFVAFTFSGLEALASGSVRFDPTTFIPEFRQGMTHPARARALGDLDTESWHWGGAVDPARVNGSPRSQPIHMLCALYADSALGLGAWLDAPENAPASTGFDRTRKVLATFEDTEPFGFRDGISQPYIEREPGQRHGAERDRLPAGEIILGYRNLFGQFPASPVVPGDPASPAPALPRAPLSEDYDLGRNGSFLVVRELEQHVKAFQTLPQSVRARMIGRWPNGQPLVTHPVRRRSAVGSARWRSVVDDAYGDDVHPIDGEQSTGRNNFDYFHADAAGMRCPLGAHIRRANPRDALSDELLDVPPSLASRRTKEHRLLRRSRVFGASGADDGYQGIFFMCFNANIERQFEFVQQTWVNNTKFTGTRNESDPLLSTGGSFTARTGPDREVIPALSQYVTVRGGAYFFMPGLSALRFLVSQ